MECVCVGGTAKVFFLNKFVVFHNKKAIFFIFYNMEISGNLYHDGTRVLVFGVCKSSTIDIVLVISGVLVVVLVPLSQSTTTTKYIFTSHPSLRKTHYC